jgi:WD40 repeat protein
MDAHSLNPAKIYTGHVNHKFCIPSTFVLNAQMGPCVASGSEDNKVYIWDVQSLKVVQTLEGHADAVLGLSEHPREAVLATGSMNGEIIVWREGYDHDQGQK